jgi:hypothetical protein
VQKGQLKKKMRMNRTTNKKQQFYRSAKRRADSSALLPCENYNTTKNTRHMERRIEAKQKLLVARSETNGTINSCN